MIKTKEELDIETSKRLIRLSRKYPDFCLSYLVEMHKALDWAENKLKKLT